MPNTLPGWSSPGACIAAFIPTRTFSSWMVVRAQYKAWLGYMREAA
jgi:hypothetical protein